MTDLSLVRRNGEREHHIAERHAHGPFRISPHGLCGAYAAQNWAHTTRLTLAGVNMLRDMGRLCEECDHMYAKMLAFVCPTLNVLAEGTIRPRKKRMP